MTQVINTACLSLPARPGKPKPGLETGREVLCLVREAAQRLFGLPGFGQDAGESVQCPNQIGFKRTRILFGKPTPNPDGLPNSLQRTPTITQISQPNREIVQRPRQVWIERSRILFGKPAPNLNSLPNSLQRTATITQIRQPNREIVQRHRQDWIKRSRILFGKPTINLNSPPNSLQRTPTNTHLRQPNREIVHVGRPLCGGHVLFLVAAHCRHGKAAQIRVPRWNRVGYFGCRNIHSAFQGVF